MNECIHEEEYRGFTIKVYPDYDEHNNPRDWDNLGTMVCWHKRYTLGDEGYCPPSGGTRYESVRDWREDKASNHVPFDVDGLSDATLWKIVNRYYLVLELGLLDHSGLHMWVGGGAHWSDSAGWDSGSIGFIYVSHEDIRENWSVKSVRHKVKRHGGGRIKAIDYARNVLKSEVDTYDDFLTGSVYGYVIETPEGEEIGSCWGFFGDYDKNTIPECASIIDHHIKSEREDHFNMLKGWIRNKVPLRCRQPLEV